MNKKLVYCLLVCLVITTSLFLACTSTTSSSSSSSTVSSQTASSTETFANWWDKFGEPQYGGTIIMNQSYINTENLDPGVGMGSDLICYERLFTPDAWTLDRNTWNFQVGFCPIEHYTGMLGESWEQTEPLVITVHLREGVKWENKAPLNGREVIADDIQQHFDRILGTGSGYTTANPYFVASLPDIEKVIAVDKYTVEFKLKRSSALTIYQVLNSAPIGSPELAKAGLEDWSQVAGTGGWLLTDFVSGSSITYSRNPDYYGYDERYPENQLPYADTYKILVISDSSTAMASFRTGKIDIAPRFFSWQQVKMIQETNPDTNVVWMPFPGYSMVIRVDKEPFTDIRVRKALQLAIDRQAIAENIYGGYVDGIPCGLTSPTYTGWTLPYEEWDTELQQEYSYDVDKAKSLLAEAGYPNGFDTNIVCSQNAEMESLQALKGFLMEINVDMEIKILDSASFKPYVNEGKHDQMVYSSTTGVLMTPDQALNYRLWANIKNGNYGYVNDATYESIVANFNTTDSMEEAMAYSTEANMYALQMHWAIQVCPRSIPMLWQSWIKGYSGEMISSYELMRIFVDQDAKSGADK